MNNINNMARKRRTVN